MPLRSLPDGDRGRARRDVWESLALSQAGARPPGVSAYRATSPSDAEAAPVTTPPSSPTMRRWPLPRRMFSIISPGSRNSCRPGACSPTPPSCSFTSATGSPSPSARPAAVVFPTTTAEVVAVVKTLAEAGVQIVPRGSGTGLAGGCVAFENGVIVSTTRLNRILLDRPGQPRGPRRSRRAQHAAFRRRRRPARRGGLPLRPRPFQPAGQHDRRQRRHQRRRHPHAQGFRLLQPRARDWKWSCPTAQVLEVGAPQRLLRVRRLRPARPDLRQRRDVRHHHRRCGCAWSPRPTAFRTIVSHLPHHAPTPARR